MVVGLDVGTSFIRVAIGAEKEDGGIEITGVACRKSAGLRNGVIVNIEDAMTAIRETIEEAEQNAGTEVFSCFTAIGGTQIEGINSRGLVAVTPPGKSPRAISDEDVKHVIEAARAVQIPLDRQTLHTIAQDFIVDGVEGIKKPMNMLAVRLEAAVHIITASKTTIQNITSCINRAGYQLDGVWLKTLAATRAVAHDDELELGSILIDLGAGTTDVLVLVDGAPVCTTSIPVGGNLVTNDIVIVKGIPTVTAEKLKIESGCCWLPSVHDDMEVIIPGVGGRAPEATTQTELCQIIQARMEEIFTMVRNAIIHKTNLTQLSGNIILTGAGAEMEGVVELAQSVFGTTSVRLGIPEKLGGPEEEYRKPEWATAVGLVLANKETAQGKSGHKNKKILSSGSDSEKTGIWEKASKLLKSFF